MTLPILKIPGNRSYPPRMSAFTRPFWEGLAQGHWRTTHCEACGKTTFAPKPICPHCWADKMRWGDFSSQGTLYTWTRIHAAPLAFVDEAPFAVGIVDLDIGLRIAIRIVSTPNVDPQVGMPVEIVMLSYDDGPMFASRRRQSAGA